MTRRRRLAVRPRLEILDERLLLSALTPAQIDSAYGLNAVTFSKGTIKGDGAGQTIAIIGAYNAPFLYGDLWNFDARNGLPNPYLCYTVPQKFSSPNAQPGFAVLDFAGGTTNPLWNEEAALDVEMAHAAAPGANIILVEAKTPGIYDFITAIDAVKTLPSVTVVSMSWEASEFYGQQAYDGTFTTPAGHAGITFLAASGDEGAGAAWPASSPDVVGVGGTSLVLGPSGSKASESAWGGSGGGPSQYVAKPGYQAQVVPGGSRSTPDVSIDADPNSGVVIDSWGHQYEVGGTSLSTPLWAGLVAIADEGLAIAGKSTLDGATQTLPDLYKAPSGSFFDVTTGTRASAGYDTSTGLGSPIARTLVGFLDGASAAAKVTAGGGTAAVVGGKTISASPSLSPSSPTPTGPTLNSSMGVTSAPWSSPTVLVALMPEVVSVPTPTIPIGPGATDAAIEAWYAGGSIASGSPTRSKARG